MVRLRSPAPAYMGEFPSGQRGQTVNLLSLTSLVRIQLPPPYKETDPCGRFFYMVWVRWDGTGAAKPSLCRIPPTKSNFKNGKSSRGILRNASHCVLLCTKRFAHRKLTTHSNTQLPPQKKDCNFGTKLQSFLTKSAYVGINPLTWMKSLCDEILLCKVVKRRESVRKRLSIVFPRA